MKYRNKPSIFKSRLGLFIIILAVVVLLLIVFGSKASDSELSKNQTTNDSVNKTQESVQAVNTEPETKTDLEKVIEKTLSEKGLCEDYNFNEGDSLEIKDTNITLDRVSSTTAKLIVDKETIFLTPGNDKVINNLRIELHKGNLYYFGAGDKENVVILRIGCKYSDENPNEKYVRERGEKLCQEVYTQCRESFGIA